MVLNRMPVSKRRNLSIFQKSFTFHFAVSSGLNSIFMQTMKNLSIFQKNFTFHFAVSSGSNSIFMPTMKNDLARNPCQVTSFHVMVSHWSDG